MMRLIKFKIGVFLIILGVLSCRQPSVNTLEIKVSNPLNSERKSETIALEWKALIKKCPDLVKEQYGLYASDQETRIPVQLLDLKDGSRPVLLFQADLYPMESKTFVLKTVAASPDTQSSAVHAAYVSEGMDDFNWENDKIGYRFYGKARKVEGVSSGIDVWCKRVPYPMTEKWYDPAINYHKDSGEGADYYRVKDTRGCGGSAIVVEDEFYVSDVYTDWKILASGPVRTVFQLTFPPVDVEGQITQEIKTVSLDAGHYFSRFDVSIKKIKNAKHIVYGIGLAEHGDFITHEISDNVLISWEALGQEKGFLGCGVIVDPVLSVRKLEDKQHQYLAVPADETLTYYAGAAWSEYGAIQSPESWRLYAEQWLKKVENPVKVELLP